MIDEPSAAVRFDPSAVGDTNPFVAEVLVRIPASIDDSLSLAQRLATRGAIPGNGETCHLWEALATLGAHDLGSVRAAEPHLDAAAILAQAEIAIPTGSWGVFAAEGGEHSLRARHDHGSWVLDGTKPWCSLAGKLDHAIVTAWVGDVRSLFAVDLSAAGLSVQTGNWYARGLTEIPSESVHFEAVAAAPVGAPGWYLTRPGFDWGAIGVAACWYGGAVGIARTLYAAAVVRADDPVLLMHLGAIDGMLQAARRALFDAAREVDNGADVRILSKEVRALVARACEEVLIRSGHALGPAPLAHDERHAKRVADLTLYLRQHHAERDEISLGRSLVEMGHSPW